jgi:hypothetical protein
MPFGKARRCGPVARLQPVMGWRLKQKTAKGGFLEAAASVIYERGGMPQHSVYYCYFLT